MENLKFRLHDKDGVVIGYEEHKKNEHGCYQIWQKSLRGDFYETDTMNVREGFFIAAHHKCQLTGLTDKNGKEIYEGDVDRNSGHIVKWHQKRACYALFDRRDNIVTYPLLDKDLLIIGNVHENHELIGT